MSNVERVRIEQVQGVWVVFGEGKYPHDPPRPASGLEIVLHGQLQGAVSAERERCAEIVRGFAKPWNKGTPTRTVLDGILRDVEGARS